MIQDATERVAVPRRRHAVDTAGSTLVRGYVLAALVAVLLLGGVPYAWIAAGFAALQVMALIRSPRPEMDLAMTLPAVVLAPPGLSSLIGPYASVAVMLPGLLLLDAQLRDLALVGGLPSFRPGRRSTTVANALAAVAVAVVLIGLLAGDAALVSVASAIAVWLVARIGHVAWTRSHSKLAFGEATLRVLAGERGTAALRITNPGASPMRLRISSSEQWLTFPRPEIELAPHSTTEIELRATPGLAGPSHPPIEVMSQDEWGLVWTGFQVSPLTVSVTPKARYAEWLARRYLEQTGDRDGASSAAGRQTRGVEWTRLREYQPGDRLKDVDWRRTAKYRELISKEHLDPQAGGTLIVCNLVAGDAEEADWLGYHIVSSALTAAQAGVPAALVAYDSEGVAFTTGGLVPSGREVVKHALRVMDKIVETGHEERLLAPPDVLRLRRRIGALQGSHNEADAGAFGGVLARELSALEELAKTHPLTPALQQVMRDGARPETVTLISRWNHDSEALAVARGRLQQLGYRVIDVLSHRAESPRRVAPDDPTKGWIQPSWEAPIESFSLKEVAVAALLWGLTGLALWWVITFWLGRYA